MFLSAIALHSSLSPIVLELDHRLPRFRVGLCAKAVDENLNPIQIVVSARKKPLILLFLPR